MGGEGCGRAGCRECSVGEPAAHAALCGSREVVPLLPSAQQHIGPTAPTPGAARGGRASLPHARTLRAPRGAASRGWHSGAPPRARSGTGSLRLRVLGPAARAAHPDGLAGASSLLRFGVRGGSRTSWSRRRGARRPAPGGPEAASSAGGRPCSAGYLRAAPAPPRQPGSGPPRPAAGFVHRPAAAPPRSRRLLPAPCTPAPLPRSGGGGGGAGGGRGPGTKGLSRALPGAEGSGAEPSAVLRPLQRKKCPPEETHKFYSGGPPARPGSQGRPGPRAASPARIRELARGKVTRAAGRCAGKPGPALPAKVNFNRGGGCGDGAAGN